jgi:dihydrofolate reductase
MSNVVLYMSMSFDGMISGHDDRHGQGLGVNGAPLHDWLSNGDISPGSHRPGAGANAEIFDEMMQTGAVITGRRTFELAGGWGGDHHDGVPVFVLTRRAPEQAAPGHARYATDLQTAVTQAKEAAGDRNVLLHGGSAARSLLGAGLVDELVIHLVPIILGRGRRLFDDPSTQPRNLQLVRAVEGDGVLHLRYRVTSE